MSNFCIGFNVLLGFSVTFAPLARAQIHGGAQKTQPSSQNEGACLSDLGDKDYMIANLMAGSLQTRAQSLILNDKMTPEQAAKVVQEEIKKLGVSPKTQQAALAAMYLSQANSMQTEIQSVSDAFKDFLGAAGRVRSFSDNVWDLTTDPTARKALFQAAGDKKAACSAMNRAKQTLQQMSWDGFCRSFNAATQANLQLIDVLKNPFDFAVVVEKGSNAAAKSIDVLAKPLYAPFESFGTAYQSHFMSGQNFKLPAHQKLVRSAEVLARRIAILEAKARSGGMSAAQAAELRKVAEGIRNHAIETGLKGAQGEKESFANMQRALTAFAGANVVMSAGAASSLINTTGQKLMVSAPFIAGGGAAFEAAAEATAARFQDPKHRESFACEAATRMMNKLPNALGQSAAMMSGAMLFSAAEVGVASGVAAASPKVAQGIQTAAKAGAVAGIGTAGAAYALSNGQHTMNAFEDINRAAESAALAQRETDPTRKRIFQDEANRLSMQGTVGMIGVMSSLGQMGAAATVMKTDGLLGGNKRISLDEKVQSPADLMRKSLRPVLERSPSFAKTLKASESKTTAQLEGDLAKISPDDNPIEFAATLAAAQAKAPAATPPTNAILRAQSRLGESLTNSLSGANNALRFQKLKSKQNMQVGTYSLDAELSLSNGVKAENFTEAELAAHLAALQRASINLRHQ